MALVFDPESDLSWLSFRYVAGEMGHDEAEVFEARLDRDQAARESVAEAVALAGAIAALTSKDRPVLPATLAASRGRDVRPIAAIVALAAAACLAWLVVNPPAQPSGPEVANRAPAAASRPSESVTLAWSKLQQEREGEAESEGGVDGPNDLLASNDDPAGLSEIDDVSDHGLPLWLLDAASLAGHPGGPSAAIKEN
jgi:hypothetical protein